MNCKRVTNRFITGEFDEASKLSFTSNIEVGHSVSKVKVHVSFSYESVSGDSFGRSFVIVCNNLIPGESDIAALTTNFNTSSPEIMHVLNNSFQVAGNYNFYFRGTGGGVATADLDGSFCITLSFYE